MSVRLTESRRSYCELAMVQCPVHAQYALAIAALHLYSTYIVPRALRGQPRPVENAKSLSASYTRARPPHHAPSRTPAKDHASVSQLICVRVIQWNGNRRVCSDGTRHLRKDLGPANTFDLKC
jgi:hypothetical protein